MNSNDYQAELERLQVELAKLQHWVQASGARIVVQMCIRDRESDQHDELLAGSGSSGRARMPSSSRVTISRGDIGSSP